MKYDMVYTFYSIEAEDEDEAIRKMHGPLLRLYEDYAIEWTLEEIDPVYEEDEDIAG